MYFAISLRGRNYMDQFQQITFRCSEGKVLAERDESGMDGPWWGWTAKAEVQVCGLLSN